MKLWIDATTPPPGAYSWAKNIDMAFQFIESEEMMYRVWHEDVSKAIEEINMDKKMVDGYELIQWLEDTNHNIDVLLHEGHNVVGCHSIKKQEKATIWVGESVGDEWTLTISQTID